MSTLTTTIQYSFGSSHPIYSTPSLSDTAGLGDAFALAARGDRRSKNLGGAHFEMRLEKKVSFLWMSFSAIVYVLVRIHVMFDYMKF